MSSPITAVILAGGVGSRFRPFAGDKTLFPFLGKPLLQHTLELVISSGITSLVVATNETNTAWLKAYAAQLPSEISLVWKQQPHPLGMSDAVLALQDLLPKKDILIMNSGDIVDDHLLPELLAQIPDQYGVITGMVTPAYQPLGYLVLDDHQHVVGIAEKPGAENMPSDVANLVFHYFSQPSDFLEILNALPSSGEDDLYEQALTQLLQTHQFGVYRYQGGWQKLKYGFHVLDMMELFQSRLSASIAASAQLDSSAIIQGEVVIDEGVRVYAGATIIGPTYIGRKAVVGNNALVRQSLVEAGSTVGFGSEVARSYVGPGSDLHHAYVGDSVLESRVHFGYNAHTANLRFDQQEVSLHLPGDARLPTGRTKFGALLADGADVGVNVSILPGMSIGTNTRIYPGSIVHQPIPDNVTVKSYQQQEIVSQ